MTYRHERNNENFWQSLAKPFFCLAPMSDVTDVAFRHMLAKYSKRPTPNPLPKSARMNRSDGEGNSESPSLGGGFRRGNSNVVFWTEFVAADGLCHKLARKKLTHILKFSERERPIVAQVFGANPENMKMACQYIASLGFDGIDINMGCPDKSVVAQGAGSALIRTPDLARKIIQSAHEGIVSAGQHIPVSVKTRIGFNKEEIDSWIPELLKEDISALTVHLRTKKEESLVPAHWEMMERIIKLRDQISPETLIIGNGDIKDLTEAREKAEKYDCDGIMIGRGVFGNPWFFSEQKPGLGYSQSPAFVPTLKEKVEALVEHIKLFDEKLMKTGDKNYDVMKKHFKAYINGFNGAQEVRNKLMETETPAESIRILTAFQKTLK